MISKLILVSVLITLLSPTFFAETRAQNIKLYPVDEASTDLSFKRFRDRLIGALKKRDKRFLLSVLHSKIRNSFGGDGGVREFVEMWKLNEPDSDVWSELLTVLSMGGSFYKDQEDGRKTFEVPYVSSRWDSVSNKLPGGGDPFSYSAIIGQSVPIYSRPIDAAPPIEFLSYDVVEVDRDRSVYDSSLENLRWVKIKTLKGQEGYVKPDRIRSAVDMRAYFIKLRGKWVMTAFIAGD